MRISLTNSTYKTINITIFVLLAIISTSMHVNIDISDMSAFINQSEIESEEYFFKIDIFELESQKVPFFGNNSLSSNNNVFHLVSLIKNGTGYFGQFEQGFWNRDEGTYTVDSSISKTSVLNLSWTIIYPIESYEAWEAYAVERSDYTSNNIESIYVVLRNHLYIENINFITGNNLSITIDVRDNVIREYRMSFYNNSELRFFTILGSDFDSMRKEENNNYFLTLIVFSLSITVIIVSVIIYKIIQKKKNF